MKGESIKKLLLGELGYQFSTAGWALNGAFSVRETLQNIFVQIREAIR